MTNPAKHAEAVDSVSPSEVTQVCNFLLDHNIRTHSDESGEAFWIVGRMRKEIQALRSLLSPTDDDEPADVEWLEGVGIHYGAEDDKPESFSYTQGGAGGPTLSLWWLDKFGQSSSLLAANPTRGQVRHLLAALTAAGDGVVGGQNEIHPARE